MTCDEARSLLVRKVGREASPEEVPGAARHATECTACSSYARELDLVWRWTGEMMFSNDERLPIPRGDPRSWEHRGGLLYVLAAAALFVFVAVILVGPLFRNHEPAGGTDLYGDPLPEGATARMGTVRLRGVRLMAYAADGKSLISANGNSIRLWDAVTGKERLRFKEATPIVTFASSMDGRTIASGGYDKTVRVWDASTGNEILKLEATGGVEAVALSPEGNAVAAGGKKGTIHIWNAKTGKPILELDGHPGGLRTLAYSPDGRTLASGGADGLLRLWNPEDGRPLRSFAGHSDPVTCTAFSPDGRLLASGGDDKTARLWDIAKGELLRKVEVARVQAGEMKSENVKGIAISPDGRRMAAISETHTIYLFDLSSGNLIRLFLEPVHGNSSSSMATFVSFSPDGHRLASGGYGDAGHLWNVETGLEERLGLGASHQFHVCYTDVSPDGHLVASQGMDGSTAVWEMSTGRQVLQFETSTLFSKAIAISPDGASIASIAKDGHIILRDFKTGRSIRTFEPEQCRAMTFSPTGKELAFVSNSALHLLDIAEGKVRLSLGEGFGIHDSLAFSPDGGMLAGCGYSKKPIIQLWDTTSGRLLRELTGHTGPLTGLAFSPDGRVLASSAEDRTIRLWNPADGQELYRVNDAHWNRVHTVAFSPDGRMMASGGDDGIVRLWEVATAKRILELKGHNNWNWVWCVAFSPDGRSLVSGSADTTLLVWALGRPGSPTAEKAQSLEDLWADLGSEDAARAYRAIWALSEIPREAIPLLKLHLLPNPPDPGMLDQIRRRITDLDSDDVGTREKAFQELKKSGPGAEIALTEALKGSPSPELRGRVTALLSVMSSPVPYSPEALQRARAIWGLEKMRAIDVLQGIRVGSPSSRDRRDAEAAIRRLKK